MELNAFQQWCFNTPLEPQVLEDVKAVLLKNIQDGICNGCVTMKGISFHEFIQMLSITVIIARRIHVPSMFIHSTWEKRSYLGSVEKIRLQ